jgi:hypothetical protein
MGDGGDSKPNSNPHENEPHGAPDIVSSRAGRIRNSVCVLTGYCSLGTLTGYRASTGGVPMSHEIATS